MSWSDRSVIRLNKQPMFGEKWICHAGELLQVRFYEHRSGEFIRGLIPCIDECTKEKRNAIIVHVDITQRGKWKRDIWVYPSCFERYKLVDFVFDVMQIKGMTFEPY